MNLSLIRKQARTSLDYKLLGNTWLSLVLIDVIFTVLVGIPNTISIILTRVSPAAGASISPLISLASLFLSAPLSYGIARIFLQTARGEKKINVSSMFCGFKEAFLETVILGIARTLFIFLWALLFLIPGIIKSYSYSMAFYIQQESEDKTWRSCINKSIALTNGYKGKLFLLDLSFIGWYLLGLLCFGIGVFWVEAYHETARAHFYEELKKIKAEELSDMFPKDATSDDEE